jgi:hypothetical protein
MTGLKQTGNAFVWFLQYIYVLNLELSSNNMRDLETVWFCEWLISMDHPSCLFLNF